MSARKTWRKPTARTVDGQTMAFRHGLRTAERGGEREVPAVYAREGLLWLDGYDVVAETGQ